MEQPLHSVGALEMGEGEAQPAADSKSRPSARQAFEDCPLIEIVHFHECLRGELRSLQTNVATLCRQMRDLHQKTSASSAAGSAAATGRPSQKQDGVSPASAPIALLCDEGQVVHTHHHHHHHHSNEDGKWAAATKGPAAAAGAGTCTGEHLKLEVQVQSQFQLLWAVFQSHSTAEDEVIWPALKEKARSSGGKLKLVNHDGGSNSAAAEIAAAATTTSATGTTTAVAATAVERRPSTTRNGSGGGGGGTPKPKESREPTCSSSLEGGKPAGAAGVGADSGAKRSAPAAVGDSKGRAGGVQEEGEEEERFGEAMIDEAEYTEEHHEEQRLFEDMQELLTGLRNTRYSSIPERLQVVACLGKKTDEMCRHLMTHLEKEEDSALPLIKHYFTRPEMGALVGKIMGKRPTELMQTILAMMIKNLPAEEVHTVMGYMRHAVKDTYFEKWLASGGFQWPTNAPSKVEGAATNEAGPVGFNTASVGAVWPIGAASAAATASAATTATTASCAPGGSGAAASGGRCDGEGSAVGTTSYRPPFPLAASYDPITTPAAEATGAASASMAETMPTSAGLPSAVFRSEGVGVKRPAMEPAPALGVSAGVGGRGGKRDGCCLLDREFEGMSIGNRAGKLPQYPSAITAAAAGDAAGVTGGLSEKNEALAHSTGGAGLGGSLAGGGGGGVVLASGQAETGDRCSVCSYIGRCPVNEPLSQAEFETAVKRLSHVGSLSAERKSGLVQMMRNHMYKGRKRPRPGSVSAPHPSGTGFSSSSSTPLCPTGGVWPPAAATLGAAPAAAASAAAAGGGTGVALAAPARHYTTTQPDIEDASGSGADGGRYTLLPPALFTPEELAPTYHHVSPGGGVDVGGGGAGPAGSGRGTQHQLSGEAAGGEGVGGSGDGGGGGGEGGGQVVLGCPHYRRACKMRAPCCQRLFTCRLCHDHASDHTMDREEVTEMLCMRCGTLQPVHSECRNPSCRPTDAEGKPPDTGRKMARYYCGICHLFDDAPGKDIYHCPYCNMCRLGKGLGVDFFHCMTCNACISSKTPMHTCLSKSLESDCPICSNSLFTSTSQVKGLRCGHFMHLACYKEYIGRAESREFWYRCPVCRKSMEDMREYFSQMDSMVASQPMPEEYSGWKTKVLCHDCESYTEVPYHFYYLKCGACGSYNTRTEGNTPREGGTGDASLPTA